MLLRQKKVQDQPHVIQRSVEDGGLAMMVWENEKVSGKGGAVIKL